MCCFINFFVRFGLAFFLATYVEGVIILSIHSCSISKVSLVDVFSRLGSVSLLSLINSCKFRIKEISCHSPINS